MISVSIPQVYHNDVRLLASSECEVVALVRVTLCNRLCHRHLVIQESFRFEDIRVLESVWVGVGSPDVTDNYSILVYRLWL